MLIVFSGLPGTGKTTIAWVLAARLGAVVDTAVVSPGEAVALIEAEWSRRKQLLF